GVDYCARFLRDTKVSSSYAVIASTASAVAGGRLFDSTGCSTCHVSSITTARPGTVIDGGTFVVPEALGNKIIHPYGDFLLHDIGTGDGIVQAGPQDTANKLRTAPLWGLRTRPRLMHDHGSLTMEDAIERHKAEAADVTERCVDLVEARKQQLFTFLNSL